MNPGDIYESRNYGKFEIVENKSYYEVLIKFVDTGYQYKVSRQKVKTGKVKDKTMPSIYGVGFIGDGPYKTKRNGNEVDSYKKWYHMLTRCYSESYQKRFPSYVGCRVDERWHNFQVFAKWYEDNYPKQGSGYQIDKDIIKKGNRVYAPELCSFVTRGENIDEMNDRYRDYYVVISPDGKPFICGNQSDFAIEHGLKQASISSLVTGKIRKLKGWVLYKRLSDL